VAARGTRGTGRRETWNGVGGVPGGHFERIYRLFGGRAPLGHSQGWLVCHTTNPQPVLFLLRLPRGENRVVVRSRASSDVIEHASSNRLIRNVRAGSMNFSEFRISGFKPNEFTKDSPCSGSCNRKLIPFHIHTHTRARIAGKYI
jgi:hypothetical protein